MSSAIFERCIPLMIMNRNLLHPNKVLGPHPSKVGRPQSSIPLSTVGSIPLSARHQDPQSEPGTPYAVMFPAWVKRMGRRSYPAVISRRGARYPCKAFACGHTASNAPDPIRTRKLSGARPGQYWGGGPPGKPFGCRKLFSWFGNV